MLHRLADREVLVATAEELDALWKRLQTMKGRAHLVAAFAAALMTVAFLLAWADELGAGKGVLMAVEVVSSYGAGYYLGRMVLNGRILRALRDVHIELEVQPEHPDGAAGLKILGDTFFRQAAIAGIPAVYLAFWVGLIPAMGMMYRDWAVPYAFLLPFAIAFELLAALAPLYLIHREMARQKAKRLADADGIGREIIDIRQAIGQVEDPKEAERLAGILKRKVEYYGLLEGMPTWPVGKANRQRFAVGNLALVALPIVSRWLGDESIWTKVYTRLQELLALGP